MNAKKLNFIFIILLSNLLCPAQTFEAHNFSVNANNKILKYPWTGGMNTPQIMNSTVHDGAHKAQLTIFDRTGGVWLPFDLQQGELIYKPQLKKLYPQVKEWVHMADYNGDGLKDLFSYSTTPGIAGIDVYVNMSTVNKTTFTKVRFPADRNDVLYYSSGASRFNLYVSNIDYPGFADIDKDGDLDIITYDIGGALINWYKNQSVEKKLGLNTFDFILADPCFGKVVEDGFSERITLSADMNKCASGLAPILEVRHSGSTVLCFDKDLDNDFDLLIGDISSAGLIYLKNGGTTTNAWMTDQELKFPSNSKSVDIPYFVSSFSADVTGDSINELFAASNFNFGSDNYHCLWRYDRNKSQHSNFDFVSNGYIVNESIDFGENTYPAIADIDGDGLEDFVVGSGGYFDRTGLHSAALFLFKNIGTKRAPAFQLVDSNWLDFKKFSTETNSFAPSFGDIDNDGDLDLIIGELLGRLYFSLNTGGKDKPMKFDNIVTQFSGIDVGQYSTPIIHDLDIDGKPDLIIGERDGVINFFKNKGSVNSPLFSSVPEINPLGGIDTRVLGFATGNATPFIFQNNKNKFLAVGTSGQNILLYDQILATTSGYRKIAFNWGNVFEGDETHPAISDIDQDGFFDVLVGNQRGGLAWYKTDIASSFSTSTYSKDENIRIQIFPNPSNEKITISTDFFISKGALKLIDLTGKILIQQKINSNKIEIDISRYPEGVYIFNIGTERGKVAIKKFIIKR